MPEAVEHRAITSVLLLLYNILPSAEEWANLQCGDTVAAYYLLPAHFLAICDAQRVIINKDKKPSGTTATTC